MSDTPGFSEREEWVIWNSGHGLAITAAVGQIEIGADGRKAWLDKPFEMIGPFSLGKQPRPKGRSFSLHHAEA